MWFQGKKGKKKKRKRSCAATRKMVSTSVMLLLAALALPASSLLRSRSGTKAPGWFEFVGKRKGAFGEYRFHRGQRPVSGSDGSSSSSSSSSSSGTRLSQQAADEMWAGDMPRFQQTVPTGFRSAAGGGAGDAYKEVVMAAADNDPFRDVLSKLHKEGGHEGAGAGAAATKEAASSTSVQPVGSGGDITPAVGTGSGTPGALAAADTSAAPQQQTTMAGSKAVAAAVAAVALAANGGAQQSQGEQRSATPAPATPAPATPAPATPAPATAAAPAAAAPAAAAPAPAPAAGGGGGGGGGSVAVIKIEGKITADTATKFSTDVGAVDASATTIAVYINSKGGSVQAGFAIVKKMDELKAQGKTVATVCKEHVGSIATYIFAMGSDGSRYATEGCTLFFHELKVRYKEGTAQEASKLAQKINQSLKNAKKVYDEIAKACKMGGDQSSGGGLCAKAGLCVCDADQPNCTSGKCGNFKACTLKGWGCIDTVWTSTPADGTLPKEGKTDCSGDEQAKQCKNGSLQGQGDDQQYQDDAR